MSQTKFSSSLYEGQKGKSVYSFSEWPHLMAERKACHPRQWPDSINHTNGVMHKVSTLLSVLFFSKVKVTKIIRNILQTLKHTDAFRVFISPNLKIFGLWEETGASGGHPSKTCKCYTESWWSLSLRICHFLFTSGNLGWMKVVEESSGRTMNIHTKDHVALSFEN